MKLLTVLITSILLLIHPITGSAQCTPDTSITSTGIYPATLPHAYANIAYNQIIQFKFPKDTTIANQKIVFDSLRLIAFDSAPSFMQYQCNTNPDFSACTWKGGSNGCVTFYGTPALADTGVYRIKVTIKAFFKLFNNPTSRDFTNNLTFVVEKDSASNTSVSNIVNESTSGGNFPNPFIDKTDIVFYANKGGNKYTLAITDITGKKVYKKEGITKAGENRNEIDAADFPAGVYIYTICSGNDCITRRMLKSQN